MAILLVNSVIDILDKHKDDHIRQATVLKGEDLDLITRTLSKAHQRQNDEVTSQFKDRDLVRFYTLSRELRDLDPADKSFPNKKK